MARVARCEVLGADAPRVLHVRRFAYASGHGGSNSLVLNTDDGGMALVKFKGNPQSSRALVGDLVGTVLGRRVGAAFPEPVLVHVPFDDLTKIPPLRIRRWIPGIQFGTVFRTDARPLGDGDARRLDLDSLPVTALVEMWLHNGDLKVDHLLRVQGPAGPEVMVVDHGHVFPGGPSWTAARLRSAAESAPDVTPLSHLARSSGKRFDFSRAVADCTSLGEAEIAAVVARVPAEWALSPADAAALNGFLARRRALLPRWAEDLQCLWNDRGLPS